MKPQNELKKPQEQKNQPGKFQPQTNKKKDPEEIPILRYGASDNFHKLCEVLSKKALKEYGNLGKLIKQGTYFEPEEPDYAYYGSFDTIVDTDGFNEVVYLEDVIELRKEKSRFRRGIPQIFALPLQYLSDESIEAIQRQQDWNDVEKDNDAYQLSKLIEEIHKNNKISRVASIRKKVSARVTYK
jgi:hypothetical protein